jgi:hypothetical protein
VSGKNLVGLFGALIGLAGYQIIWYGWLMLQDRTGPGVSNGIGFLDLLIPGRNAQGQIDAKIRGSAPGSGPVVPGAPGGEPAPPGGAALGQTPGGGYIVPSGPAAGQNAIPVAASTVPGGTTFV